MTKEQRSFTMSRIRSHGNASTERAFIEVMRAHSVTGWRRRVDVCGRPDFVFPKQRVAVFIDGCFWHGCPKCGLKSKSNASYWSAKIAGNSSRDAAVTKELRAEGWHVLRIWEHTVKKHPKYALQRVTRALKAG